MEEDVILPDVLLFRLSQQRQPTFLIQQVCHNLELVALINEELLALGGVIHLLGVLGN